MSGSWLSVCLLLFAFMVTVNLEAPVDPYSDPKNGCSECPVPLQAQNILEDLQLTEDNTTIITLEWRPCNNNQDGLKGTFFRLRNVRVDGKSVDRSLLKMDAWEKYGPCDQFCTVNVIVGPVREDLLDKNMVSADSMLVHCGDFCIPLSKMCDKWTNDYRRVLFKMLKELLGF